VSAMKLSPFYKRPEVRPCFDEFNRLEERMLSAVSQQIQAIQEALKEHSRKDKKTAQVQVEIVGKQVILEVAERDQEKLRKHSTKAERFGMDFSFLLEFLKTKIFKLTTSSF